MDPSLLQLKSMQALLLKVINTAILIQLGNFNQNSFKINIRLEYFCIKQDYINYSHDFISNHRIKCDDL